jgi:hypothetical protein
MLVLRPQRTITSFVLVGIGFTGFVLGAALRWGGWAASFDSEIVAVLLLLSSIFAALGLHGWFLRVEFAATENGWLAMRWTRWPLSRRERTLKLSEITDVIVETDEGTSRIVVLVGQERVPLTGSSTSDNLDGKVRELRAFLGLPGHDLAEPR